jgi:hypothetical protein
MGDEKDGGWFEIHTNVEVVFSNFIISYVHNILYGTNDTTDIKNKNSL